MSKQVREAEKLWEWGLCLSFLWRALFSQRTVQLHRARSSHSSASVTALRQRFTSGPSDLWGKTNPRAGRGPVFHGKLSNTPGLEGASSPCLPLSCANQKCFWTLPNIPEGRPAPVESHWSKADFSEANSKHPHLPRGNLVYKESTWENREWGYCWMWYNRLYE